MAAIQNNISYEKSDYSKYINNKIQDSCRNKFFCNFRDTYT